MARPVKLKDYLPTLNVAGSASMPWAHSTSASNRIDIIEDGKLLALAAKEAGAIAFLEDRRS